MMARDKKKMRGTDARGHDEHEVTIPEAIETTEDVVWMSRGKKVKFTNASGKAITLKFRETPETNGPLDYAIPVNASKTIVLKHVVAITFLKYDVTWSGGSHDPIVIIDPN